MVYHFWLLALLSLCFLHLQVSHCKDYKTIAYLKHKGISGWFTDEEKSAMKQKRIRREVRDLSSVEWQKITDAMNIMKYTDGDDGRVIYGDNYRSYDELVCFHSHTAWSYSGDFGHGIPHFGMWHRAFMLMFENILLSVDPSIESFPYWDYRIDADDPKNSEFFSDVYIGNLMGDENKEYAIKNGPFAYWPMSKADKLGCSDISNVFGLMRERINPNPSLYVTRIGETLCNKEMNYVGDKDKWEQCLMVEDYASFVACYEIEVHTGAHSGVGGTTPRVKNDDSLIVKDGNSMWCHNWLTNQWIDKDGYGIYRFYGHARTNCFDCPTCSLDDDLSEEEIEACVCVPNQSDCKIETDIGLTYKFDSLNDENTEHIWGDMMDGISSVNDPIFFFHHFNMDRYTYLWQLNFYNKKPYYGYPTSGYQYGLNLNDIASPEQPFTAQGIFDDYFDNDKDLQLTFKDIFDATDFVTAPFIYDDIYYALFDDDDEYLEYMQLFDKPEMEMEMEMEVELSQENILNRGRITTRSKKDTTRLALYATVFFAICGFVVIAVIFMLYVLWRMKLAKLKKYHNGSNYQSLPVDVTQNWGNSYGSTV